MILIFITIVIFHYICLSFLKSSNRKLHPNVLVKLDEILNCIGISSIQLDSSGTCVPLVVIEMIKPMTTAHLEYTMKWSMAGEKMAKIVIKYIKDELE